MKRNLYLIFFFFRNIEMIQSFRSWNNSDEQFLVFKLDVLDFCSELRERFGEMKGMMNLRREETWKSKNKWVIMWSNNDFFIWI